MPVVAIGGIRPKGYFSFFRFNRYAIPTFMQAKKAPGNLHTDVLRHKGIAISISVWEDHAAMRNYVMSGAHRAAMKAAPKIGEILYFVTYESGEVPSKVEAIEIWENAPEAQRDNKK